MKTILWNQYMFMYARESLHLLQVKNVPEINDYTTLISQLNCITGLNKKAGLLLKNITSFSISEIREICKQLFSSNKEEVKTSTNFKRCVMYIDLKENHI